MVNWWFGFVFWGSRCALTSQSLSQEHPKLFKPPTQTTNLPLLDTLNYIMTFGSSSHHGFFCGVYMFVSKNNGIPKSSILIGFSIINHPFWWFSPYFCFNTHYVNQWGGPSWVACRTWCRNFADRIFINISSRRLNPSIGSKIFNHQRHH